MIVRKYQDSTRRQMGSESIDTFSKSILIQWDLLMFKYFQKMIVHKYQDSTRRQKSLKTFGDTNLFGVGIPTKNIKKIGSGGSKFEKN